MYFGGSGRGFLYRSEERRAYVCLVFLRLTIIVIDCYWAAVGRETLLFSHIAYDLLYRYANTAMNQNYTVLVGSG